MAESLFKAEGTLGVDDKPLAQGLRAAEQKAVDGVKRIERHTRNIKVETASVGGLGGLAGIGKAFAGINAVAGGIGLATAGIRLFRGESEAALEAVYSLPFGIGQLSRAFATLHGELTGANAELERFAEINEKNKKLADARAREARQLKDLELGGGSGFEARVLTSTGVEKAGLLANRERTKRLAEIEEQSKGLPASSPLRRRLEIERIEVEQLFSARIAVALREREEDDKRNKERAEREEQQGQESIRRAVEAEQRKADAVFEQRSKNNIEDLKLMQQFGKAARLEIESDAELRKNQALRDGNIDLAAEIDREKQIRLRRQSLAESGVTAQAIDLLRTNVSGGSSGRGKPPANEQQADQTNTILQSILTAIRSTGVALAG